MDDFKNYGFEYEHDGSAWIANISATSEADARDRLSKAAIYGKCLGTLEGSIPAGIPGSGLFTRLYCWWQNRRAPRSIP